MKKFLYQIFLGEGLKHLTPIPQNLLQFSQTSNGIYNCILEGKRKIKKKICILINSSLVSPVSNLGKEIIC